MFYRKSLDEIRRDLKALKNYWVVVYGSYVGEGFTPRSDIDVAVITRNYNIEENMRTYWNLLPKIKPEYDLRIFELLPLHIKINVIRNHIVIFGDPLAISEYFYFYRKIWKDMEHRFIQNQYTCYEQILEGIKRRQKLQEMRGESLRF